MFLALDTSTRYAGVALANENQVIASHSWHSTYNHTTELIPTVIHILERAGVTSADLDGVVVALGPGGFSTLRVGISAAKGLALVSGKPIVGVGTLDLEAYQFIGSGTRVCALLEAGREECATALFGPDGARIQEDKVYGVDQLVAEITEPTIFCGEGVTGWRKQILSALGSKAQIVKSVPASRVWALVAMGRKKLVSGEVENLNTIQPEYLRMPSIGVSKQRDRVRQGRRPNR